MGDHRVYRSLRTERTYVVVTCSSTPFPLISTHFSDPYRSSYSVSHVVDVPDHGPLHPSRDHRLGRAVVVHLLAAGFGSFPHAVRDSTTTVALHLKPSMQDLLHHLCSLVHDRCNVYDFRQDYSSPGLTIHLVVSKVVYVFYPLPSPAVCMTRSNAELRLDLIIFITADVGALVIQSVGGAQAATAAKDGDNAEQGGRIMVGGIIFQMGKCDRFPPTRSAR